MSKGAGIKEVEEFPRRIKILIFVIVVLIAVGTIGFKLLTGESFSNSFLRTFEAMVFIFKENTVLIERLLEIFLALIGVFLVWWVLWSIADMVLDGNLRRYLKRKFYIIKMKATKNHIIIAGGGRIGEEIAKVTSAKNHNFVIIDNDEAKVRALRKKGYNVIEGNAEDEKVLKEAKIETAKKIILTLPKTETNILITLTVKDLNPKIEIYSRAENSSLIPKLKRAGAKIVIVPEIIAGDKIANDLKLGK